MQLQGICKGYLLRRHFTMIALRVCIVGGGPAGFYAAKQVLQQIGKASVDLLEQEIVPGGLVRFGIAPHHCKLRNSVLNEFEHHFVPQQRFRFFGNVRVGSTDAFPNDTTASQSQELIDAKQSNHRADDTTKLSWECTTLSLDRLRQMYDVVILACGAGDDLSWDINDSNSIAGERIFSALDIVGWYNGNPIKVFDTQYRLLNILNRKNPCRCAIVVGNGNVALDVARMLTSSYDELRNTDASLQVEEWARLSPLRKVIIVGRRGWAQASFTTTQLRQMIHGIHGPSTVSNLSAADSRKMRRSQNAKDDIADISNYGSVKPRWCILNPDTYERCSTDSTKEEIRLSRSRQRQKAFFEQMVSNWTVVAQSNQWPTIQFEFLMTPVEILWEEGSLVQVLFRRNNLVGPPGNQNALIAPDLPLISIEADFIVSCIGFQSHSILTKLSFSSLAATKSIANFLALPEDPPHLAAVYVTGWLQSGPTGTIATVVHHARQIAQEIAHHYQQNPPKGKYYPDLSEILNSHRSLFVTFPEWLNVRKEENRRGSVLGKP